MLLELASVTGSIVYVNPSQVVAIRDGAEPGLVDVALANGETVIARGRTAGVASLLEHVFREHAKAHQPAPSAGRYSERPSHPTDIAGSARPSSAPPPRRSGPAPARHPADHGMEDAGPTRRLTPFQRGDLEGIS